MKTPEQMAKEYCDQFCWNDPREEDARDAFLAGYAAAKPKWIGVKERLPEMNEEVLISYGNTPFYKLAFLIHNGDRKWFHGTYSNQEYQIDDVTHWMPLPEPPKENE